MDTSWPNPPVRFEDLHKVIGVLGVTEAGRRLEGWVLVPGAWLVGWADQGPREGVPSAEAPPEAGKPP